MSDIYASIDDKPHFSQEELDELEDDLEANEDDAPQANYETADEFIRQEVIPNLPPSAHKFLVVNPALQKKKRKPKTPAKLQATPAAGGSRKRKTDEAGVDDDDDKETKKAAIQVTVYVIVEGLKSAAATPSRKSTTQVEGVTCGPFFCKHDIDYESFKGLVARALPCKIGSLPVSKMEWRYEKPANDRKKPIGSEAGFQALSLSLGQRHKDLVINVHMPPPEKDEVTWDTGNGDFIEKPFDFDTARKVTNLPGPASAKEQIALMTENASGHVTELEAKYLINNHAALFPGKRVYHDGSCYWELTSLRLQVWAGAISQGKATIENPPNSGHFANDKKLKIASLPAQQASVDAGAPLAAFPAFNPATAHGPVLPPAPPYPLPYQYPYHIYHPQHYYPPPPPPVHPYAPYQHPPPPPAIPPPSAVPSPQPSPRKALRLNIPLEAFCTYYDIEAADVPKLHMLGYRPGMPGIENLASKEWEERAGIKPLTWNFILEAHKQLLKDVRDGKWQNLPAQV